MTELDFGVPGAQTVDIYIAESVEVFGGKRREVNRHIKAIEMHDDFPTMLVVRGERR
jgi:hypothetical protein